MAAGNNPIRGPYGDILILDTPYLDQLSNRLYDEQRQRDLLRQKQQQVIDEEFGKNIAKIKDADIPEYTKKYQEWKKAKVDLMKVKPKNQDEFIAKQLEAQRKLADVYSLGNLSARLKEEEDEIAKDYNKNPNNYDDNALAHLSARRKLAAGQLNQYKYKGVDGKEVVIDLTNPEAFRYKGSNTDFGKILGEAVGVPKQVFQEEEKLDGGLQFKITPYMYGNTPSQVKDRLTGNFALRQVGRDAERQWDNITDKEKAETIAAFTAIPADRWKKMGIDSPQDLLPKNDSKAEKLASHMAMQYAVSNVPKQGTPVFRDNKVAIDERNFKQQKEMAAIQNEYATKRLKLADKLMQGRREAGYDTWVNDYLDIGEAGAKSGQKTLLEGADDVVYEVPLDPVMLKALNIGKGETGYTPNKLYVSEKGTYYPVYVDEDGNVDKTRSVPLSRNQMVVSLGGKTVTKSQLGKEVKDTDGTIKGSAVPRGAKVTKKDGAFYYNGKKII